MTVCFICPEYPPGPHGGVGTMTQVLARGLVRSGHRVRVVGVYPAGYAAPDHEVDEGVEVLRLRQGGGRWAWVPAWRRQYEVVRAWARAGEVDLVEAPDSRGWFAGWPSLPVPLVLRAHGSNGYLGHVLGRRVSPLTRRLERASHRRADAWSAVSAYVGRVTRAVYGLSPPDRVLHNFLEAVPEGPGLQPRPGGRVVFAGSLFPLKGVVPLIEAWGPLAEAEPHAWLDVYGKDGPAPDGTGSMRTFLLDRLVPAARDRVTIHGHVGRETVVEAYRTARAAVFPSFAEAFAFAPMEAMASGCPTVYTERASGPELIGDGETGLLVDPGDPGTIGHALGRLLRDDALAARLGSAGWAHVRGAFGPDAGVAANVAYFEEVVDRFRRPR